MSESLRILLVEDDPDGRYVLERLLMGAGHVVYGAADARAALYAVTAQPFDVLLSDIGMPGIDGCELMAAIRRVRPIPGVALTGFADAKQRARCRTAGFAEFLAKPASLADVLDALARAARAHPHAD